MENYPDVGTSRNIDVKYQYLQQTNQNHGKYLLTNGILVTPHCEFYNSLFSFRYMKINMHAGTLRVVFLCTVLGAPLALKCNTGSKQGSKGVFNGTECGGLDSCAVIFPHEAIHSIKTFKCMSAAGCKSEKPVKTCCCSGDLCNTEQFADQCSAASTMMTRQYLFLVVGLVVAVYKLIIIDSL